MKKIKYLIVVILSICIATIPCYVVSANNTSDYETNVEENSSNEIIYHIDAVTHEVTTQVIDEEITGYTNSNSNNEGNVSEYIPEGSIEFPEENITPRYFLGSWTRITNTRASRYRNTVYLRVESDAGVSVGTGVFIGPNAILTAAHVVNNIRFGDDRVPNRTTAFPAYSYLTEGTTPFGSSTARSYIVSSNWADNNNHNYDWAIVILNSNLGDSVGHYGFKWQSASYNGTSIYAHGYPGEINDEENEFLYMTQGTIAKSYEFFYAVMILMQMKE